MKFYKIVNKETYEEKTLGLYHSASDAVWRAVQVVDLFKFRKSDFILTENNQINLSLDLVVRLAGRYTTLKEMRVVIDRIKVKKIMQRLQKEKKLLTK